MTLTRTRACALVFVAALAAYANSVGNGFAYDDSWVLVANERVTEGRWSEAWTEPYWPKAVPGTGNYRPVTILSFAAEWAAFDGRPAGFHVVSVAAHAGVSVLVVLLLAAVAGTVPALVGGLFFALHPVHVEAVANVVGRSELYAAAFVLLALLLYRRTVSERPAVRAAGLAGVAALYALGLLSKEMAVTLPGLLVVWSGLEGDDRPLAERLRALLPHLLVLTAVLAAYLVVRTEVLGVVTGESPASGLRGLSTSERIFTALSVWPQYLRLLVLPLDLSMDYQPAVLPLARGFTLGAGVGALLLGALVAAAWQLRRSDPLVAAGLAWFLVAILPVSNLVVRSDVLLAERTLYLPSVGAALVVAGIARRAAASTAARRRRTALAVAVLLGMGYMVRTVTRNPTWMDTFTALATLAEEHPESYLAVRSRALGLERVGAVEDAATAYETALAMVPDDYTLLVEVGEFYARRGRLDRALELYGRAMELVPVHPAAYQRVGTELIRAERYREAFHLVLDGLRLAAFPDRQLWSLLSEAHISRGDLEAAVRARRAALAVDPDSREDWRRLAELYEAMGRDEEARAARARQAAAPEPDADRTPRRIS